MRHLKIFSIFVFLFIQVVIGIAQTPTPLLWPIKNAAPGERIIGKPGDTIAGQLNYDELYIGATDSNVVVAPIGGIITDVCYEHSFPVNFSKLKGKVFPRSDTIRDDNGDKAYRNSWAAIIKEQNPQLNMDIASYISYSIGIKVGTDEMYYISGLRPVRYFKTGEAVKRGDVIGTVGYCDTAFNVPHIQISRSIKTKSEDPMGVFGIPSTFKKYKPKINYITEKHPASNLVEAFSIMRTGLEQAHPGLYDYTPKGKMDSLFMVTQQKINKPMTSEEFRRLITPIVTAIRDVHTAIYPEAYSNKAATTPEVSIGVVNGVLQFIQPCKGKQINTGTQIVAINGQPSGKIIQFLRTQYYRKDGYNELPVESELLSNFWSMYFKAYTPSASTPLKLTLENGQVFSFKYLPINATKINDDALSMSIQMIKPNIGYIDINSFDLNQVEEDSILHFIQSLEKDKVDNLIIDVRNNNGGNLDVLYRLTSYFISKSYRRNCYREVKSNTTYPAFRFTDNYSADDVLFGDFHSITSKNAFRKEDTLMVVPSSTHYSGRLYILVDEFSVSAASEFAAVFAEQGIGTIIGRETGTCYYQMNAEKFAYFHLGNTGLELMVPLIKIVAREALHPRIPYGHGVIPDIEVPLTIDEITLQKDIILERALENIVVQKSVSMR